MSSDNRLTDDQRQSIAAYLRDHGDENAACAVEAGAAPRVVEDGQPATADAEFYREIQEKLTGSWSTSTTFSGDDQ